MANNLHCYSFRGTGVHRSVSVASDEARSPGHPGNKKERFLVRRASADHSFDVGYEITDRLQGIPIDRLPEKVLR